MTLFVAESISAPPTLFALKKLGPDGSCAPWTGSATIEQELGRHLRVDSPQAKVRTPVLETHEIGPTATDAQGLGSTPTEIRLARFTEERLDRKAKPVEQDAESVLLADHAGDLINRLGQWSIQLDRRESELDFRESELNHRARSLRQIESQF